MLGKRYHTLKVWRAPVPQRDEQFSFAPTSSLVLPGQIWFTPEAIIYDALNLLSDILILWLKFKDLIPSFTLRIVAIFSLLVLIVGSHPSPNLAVSNDSYKPAVNNSFVLEAKIVASQVARFVWPVPRTYISTYYSNFHKGIDIPQTYGSPVLSYTDGKIIFADWYGGYGKAVIVRHLNGLETLYAHLSSIKVATGQTVSAGAIIGSVGCTGRCTGSHLHFEIHRDGQAINPLSILP